MKPLIRPFSGKEPQIHEGAFLAENACIIGDVRIGEKASIWYNCVLRGDVNSIEIGPYSNIQDGTVIHVNQSPSHPTIVEERVTIGHSVTLHGCVIKKHALIGIGASVLNGAIVEEEALVAAGSLVKEGQVIPRGHLVAGELTDVEQKMLRHQPDHYWDDIASLY
jgi:carbonic anhydrase/acetyltransferase-like protein (isoleucine patch superfamily)